MFVEQARWVPGDGSGSGGGGGSGGSGGSGDVDKLAPSSEIKSITSGMVAMGMWW